MCICAHSLGGEGQLCLSCLIGKVGTVVQRVLVFPDRRCNRSRHPGEPGIRQRQTSNCTFVLRVGDCCPAAALSAVDSRDDGRQSRRTDCFRTDS